MGGTEVPTAQQLTSCSENGTLCRVLWESVDGSGGSGLGGGIGQPCDLPGMKGEVLLVLR